MGISLSPSERAVCAQLGISEGDFIAQRRDPIFGTALHNTNGPFGGKRAKSPFPDAPDAQINPPHPADQRAPYSAGRPEDMEGDDDEEDDVSRRLGLGTRRRGVRVKFPPRTQV